MNKDQIKDCVEEAKANIKEVTGKPVDNDDMELEGNLQKALVMSKQALAISKGILRKKVIRSFSESYIRIQAILATAGWQSAGYKNLQSDI